MDAVAADTRGSKSGSFLLFEGKLRALLLQGRQMLPPLEVAAVDGRVDADEAPPGLSGNGVPVLTCSVCGERDFADLAEMRNHWKGEFHRFNVARHARGKRTLSREMFQRRSAMGPGECTKGEFKPGETAGGGFADESPSSTSESEGEGFQPEEGDEAGNPDGGGPRRLVAEMSAMHLATKGLRGAFSPIAIDEKRCAYFRTALLSPAAWLRPAEALRILSEPQCWDGSLKVSKTFHRYVVRRKQGGSQSSRDSSGSKPKSAGASIRRYNEMALQKDVAEVLASWAPALASCGRIFISAPATLRKVFFTAAGKRGEVPMERSDKRVCQLPLNCLLHPYPSAVRRPTLRELHRACNLLAMVAVSGRPLATSLGSEAPADVPQSDLPENLKGRDSEPLKIASSAPSPATCPPCNGHEKEPAIDRSLHEACARGDVDIVVNYCGRPMESELTEASPLLDTPDPGDDGSYPLHCAACSGRGEVITLLLESGADPTRVDARGRVAFLRCTNKATRDAFRLFRGSYPDRWDYDCARIPQGITDETKQERRRRERAKKKRQRKKKAEKKEAARAKEAAEAARMRTPTNVPKGGPPCVSCKEALPSKATDIFTANGYQYCSSKCVRDHRRALAAEAAERRGGLR